MSQYQEKNVQKNWPTDGRRTPGPFDPNETGPVAGEVVVKKGTPVFIGGGQGSRTTLYDIIVPYPTDMSEIGSAY